MNLSELINKGNVTFQLQLVSEFAIFHKMKMKEVLLSLVLGIPGNILSAIVWLRLHVASKNSSAVYLAALAINDLAYLLNELINYALAICYYCRTFLLHFTTYLEPLLVLGFSVERLIAISCPLQPWLPVYVVYKFRTFVTCSETQNVQ